MIPGSPGAVRKCVKVCGLDFLDGANDDDVELTVSCTGASGGSFDSTTRYFSALAGLLGCLLAGLTNYDHGLLVCINRRLQRLHSVEA